MLISIFLLCDWINIFNKSLDFTSCYTLLRFNQFSLHYKPVEPSLEEVK